MKHFFGWLSPTNNKKVLSFFILDSPKNENNKSLLMPFRSAYEVCQWSLVHFLIRPSSSFVKHFFNYPLVNENRRRIWIMSKQDFQIGFSRWNFLTVLFDSFWPKSVGEEEFIGMQYSNLASEICIFICRGLEDLIDRRKLLQECFLRESHSH